MNEKSDIELIALVRSGNKDAFGHLVQRYQPMAERIAMGIVSNVYLAQELAQEAMLQAYLSLDHLRDSERFKSWLYGITLNVCRGYLRDQKTDFFSLEALMGGMRFDVTSFSDGLQDPQVIAEERELHRIILRAVDGLSPRERIATLLFYYEQRSLREIAAILGITVVAVKGRLHKARKQLKEQLLMFPEWAKEDFSLRQRRRTMVKVTVVDVVRLMKQKISTVVLLDETGHRALGIWIGEAEAAMIDMGLSQSSLPRPMTMNFMASVLQAAGAVLEEVRIETLKDEIFYAIAKIRSGDRIQELDARPSDAIALAVVTGSPIFVAEEVLERCATVLPEGKSLRRIGLAASKDKTESLPEEEQPSTPELTTKPEYEKQFQRVLKILMVSL